MIRVTIERWLARHGVVIAPYWTKICTIQGDIAVYAALSTFERLDDSSFTIKIRLDDSNGTKVEHTIFGPQFIQILSDAAINTIAYTDNLRTIRCQILDLIPH